MSFRKVSFVIPAKNEEESIPELYRLIVDNINKCISQNIIMDYEFVFVDDGSTDKTGEVFRNLSEKDSHVKYILFRKNFGKSIALQTAFHNIEGDVIITMDADLQDDPCEIPNLLEKLDEGYDMVVGWKYNRLDPLEKRLPSKLFNKVTSTCSGIKLHDFDCGYKAMRREVVESFSLYGQLHRYIPVLAYRNGFEITEIPVHHNKRQYGKSKYGIERYMQGLFDFISVTFLSKYYDRPMYLFGRFGLCTGIIGVVGLILSIVSICMDCEKWIYMLMFALMFIISAGLFISIGFIGNMMLDIAYKRDYAEYHIKEKG